MEFEGLPRGYMRFASLENYVWVQRLTDGAGGFSRQTSENTREPTTAFRVYKDMIYLYFY